jgi:hypothetical protein
VRGVAAVEEEESAEAASTEDTGEEDVVTVEGWLVAESVGMVA